MPSYPNEIKVLAVHMAQDGKTLQEIRGILKRDISRQSLARWCELYKWSNAVVRNPAFYQQRGRKHKLDKDKRGFLAEMDRQKPDLYLREIPQKMSDERGVNVSITSLQRELNDRLNISWKRANKRMRKRDEEARLLWMEEYLRYPAVRFLYETFTGSTLVSLSQGNAARHR